MNRQYIGARYVPKFSDKNNGVWDNTYSYEALEIVKHGNDFYTSKIPVPVGVAITNINYWVLTGNYNGAISALQEEIQDINGDIQDINEDIGIITTPKNINKRKKCLILSDSYGGNFGSMTRNFLDLTKSYLNAQNIDCDVLHLNGASFVRTGYLFKGLLTAYTGDKDAITDIYVFGGLNDANYPLNGLSDIPIAIGISDFLTTAKSLYPNAVFHYGFIGRGARPNSGNLRLSVISTITAIQSAWIKNGGVFIPNCEYILTDCRLMQSDGLHPNDNGADKLSEFVTNAILGLGIDVQYENTISGTGYNVYECIHNGLYEIVVSASLTLESSESLNYNNAHAIDVSSMTHDLSRTFGFSTNISVASFDTNWLTAGFTISDDKLAIAPYSKTPVTVNSSISITGGKLSCNSLLIG